MSGSTPAAFISYSREDSEFTLRLAQDLKAAGALVWLDRLDIKPGHPWDSAIEEALMDAPQMLLILSPASAKSTNVRNEVRFALDEGKTIIPVLYKDCAVPLDLRRLQHVDFRADYSKGFAALLRHMQVGVRENDSVRPASETESQRQAGEADVVRETGQSNRQTSEAGPKHAAEEREVPRHLSRRYFVIGSGLVACAAAGGVRWKWDQLYDLFHPVPDKRFVALLSWPAPAASLTPVLFGVMDAIASELARAEAVDHELSIIVPPRGEADLGTPAQLSDVRDSLGANLVLAASGVSSAAGFQLLLRVLDPATTRTLRQRTIEVSTAEQLQLPEMAVQAAAKLLNITGFKPDNQRSEAGTNSPEALAAFQAGEVAKQQENDAGLEEAIEKYNQALKIDPGYAIAQAALAWAYLRLNGINEDPAALTLARRNAEAAIALDPNLVDAHVALAYVYQQIGNTAGASEEMATALRLDPSDPHTLLYQARFYAADNRWDESKATLERVLQLRPNYWLGYQDLGVMLDRQGKYREALLQFRAASLAAPKNALALKNVGSTYYQLGSLPEAIANLKASYALKPTDNAAVDLAEVYRIQQKLSDSIEYAQKATTLNPSEATNWLELGDVFATAGRPADAHSAYVHAAESQREELLTSPKDGPGTMVLALCRAKAGQSDTSLALIYKAESLHADDMDSQLIKLRVLALLEQTAEALTTAQRCLSRGCAGFQIKVMPDLEKLRTTPEYRSMVANTACEA